MIRTTAKRPGVTLMEVLIAIGILGVGMLAILALFPIGAVSMARAINMNRGADHAANSDAVFRYYWKNAWIDRQGGGSVRSSSLEAYLTSNEVMIPLLDRKPQANGSVDPLVADISPSSQQPSYVIVVDPIGYRTQLSFGLANQLYIGGQATLPARTTLAAAEADPMPFRTRTRLTTLLDDMSWAQNGEPQDLTGQLERGARYTVSWVIQRRKQSVPHEVRLFALVYGGRSPTDTPSSETYFNNASADNYFRDAEPKPNAITVNVGNQSMPNVHKGGWIAFSVPVTPSGGVRYATLDFYRVSAVTDNIAANGTISIEFEQPLRSYDPTMLLGDGVTTLPYTAATGTIYGTVIFFDNLIDVFDRGTVSAQAITGR